MRHVYLDEAGVANPRDEPHIIVAGIIVNPDEHFLRLRAYLRNLALEYLPDEDPDFVQFHAKDIFHGNGKFPRYISPRTDRMTLLEEIAKSVRMFNLPVVFGAIDRVAARSHYRKENPNIPESSIRNLEYSGAFLEAMVCVEEWMATRAGRGELATVTVENTAKTAAAAARMFHSGYQLPEDNYGYGLSREEAAKVFKSHYIVDGIHFASKTESTFLQIADTCAFIIRRHLLGRADVRSLYSILAPQIVPNPKKQVWVQAVV